MINKKLHSSPGSFYQHFIWGKIIIQKNWQWFIIFLAILLAVIALKDAPWAEALSLVGSLGIQAVIIIFLLNVVLIPMMTARWWLLLRILKTPISLFTASLYRCSSNTASYLTPGPHFGGEPLLVYYLRRYHGLAVSTAATSVVLDRLFELLASVMVLTLCFLLLLSNNFVVLGGWVNLFWITAVLITFFTLFFALFTGRTPISNLIRLLQRVICYFFSDIQWKKGSLLEKIEQSEKLVTSLYHNHRKHLLTANVLSAFYWMGIFTEFWIMSALLGVGLSFGQLCAVVLVARLAFYTPLPAGIGALELALPYITSALGLGGSVGLSLCLIIRFRDIIFSLAGLLITMKYLTCAEKISIINDKPYKSKCENSPDK